MNSPPQRKPRPSPPPGQRLPPSFPRTIQKEHPPYYYSDLDTRIRMSIPVKPTLPVGWERKSSCSPHSCEVEPLLRPSLGPPKAVNPPSSCGSFATPTVAGVRLARRQQLTGSTSPTGRRRWCCSATAVRGPQVATLGVRHIHTVC